MNSLIMLLLAVLSLILQSSLFNHFTVAGVKPDFLLILIIFYSIIQGSLKGAFLGFFLGLLEDIYLGRFIGLNALTKSVTAYAVGLLTRGAFSENLFVPIITTFLATLFNGLIFIIFGKAVGFRWSMSLWLWKAIPLAIYNTCLVPFIYARFYYWIMNFRERKISLSFWERFS